MERRVYCYDCRQTNAVDASTWDGFCRNCNSTFVELMENGSAITRTSNVSGIGNGIYASSVPRTGPSDTRVIAGEQSLVFGFINGLLPSVSIFNSEAAVNDQESLDAIISRLMEEYRPRSLPTASTIRDNLPLYKVRPANASEEPKGDEAFATAQDPCSVCHEEFVEGMCVAELPCSHCFHRSCLVPWLETHNTCPVCRIDLPFENR